MATRWPSRDGKYFHLLRVDESSSIEELEEEVEYWSLQIATYSIDGEERASLLRAIKWMNELAAEKQS
jgi:hypothetical protein